MKTDVSGRVVVIVGKRGPLPPLLEPDSARDELLVLALGPRVTREQQRAVERSIAAAVEQRIPFEARIVGADEAADLVAGLTDRDGLRAHGCSRRDLRALGLRRRRRSQPFTATRAR